MVSTKLKTWLQWIARISGTLIVFLFLPFYFGYGNPLPFLKPEYSLYDNVWLSVFPFVFIGLILGWRYPQTGGAMVVLAVLVGETFSLLTGYGLVLHMFVPLGVGVLFVGSAKKQVAMSVGD